MRGGNPSGCTTDRRPACLGRRHTSTPRIGGDVVDHDFTLGAKLFEVPVTPVHADRKLRFAETARVPHGIG